MANPPRDPTYGVTVIPTSKPKKKPPSRKKVYTKFVQKNNGKQLAPAVRMPTYRPGSGYKDAPGGTKYRGQISYDNAHHVRKV
jgi:hypothetical protein